MKATTAAVAVVLLAGTLAGCGSKSAKDRYVSKLNAMCEDFAQREQRIGEPQSGAELAQRGDRIVAAYDAALLRPLRDLQAPPEIAPQAARLRTLAGQQHDVLQGLAEAGRAGDVSRVRRLVVRNQLLNRQAGEIANELHADSCTSSG